MQNFITCLLNILGHPLFIAMSSIYLGTFLIDRINKKREKRTLKEKESIELLKEISSKINLDISWLFWQVRLQKYKICEEFSNASREAYSFRLQLKIRSNVLFDNPSISSDYREITKEIRLAKAAIQNKEIPDEEYLIQLKKKWGITNKYNIENLQYPFNIYYEWAQIIWFKTEDYLTNSLGLVFQK